MQFCEPITAFVIVPFIYELVNETGVTQGNEDRTGYYSGIIVRSILLGFLLQRLLTDLDRSQHFISARLSSRYNGGGSQTE